MRGRVEGASPREGVDPAREAHRGLYPVYAEP